MSDPFTPRFVDLVRTTTATQGTGPLVPGAAVPGFSTFAETLSAGDQFYYCVQSSARPAEREVGRGVLQADGSISRDPISGPLTAFTSGPKTVALVTAAEWFTNAGQAVAPTVLTAADRAALATKPARANLPTMLCEAGQEGVFTFQAGDHRALVAADVARAMYVAPEGQDGSAGAWVRQAKGAVQAEWFGVLPGAGRGQANSAAVVAMLAVLRLRGSVPQYGQVSTEEIRFRGYYEFAGTIELDGGVFFLNGGNSASQGAGQGTRFRFPAGGTGLRVQHNTTAGTSEARAAAGAGAQGSQIRGIRFEGAYAGTEGEAHGIHLRGTALIDSCSIVGFEGDGIMIRADVESPLRGDASMFAIRDTTIAECRDGVYCAGGDSNAGYAQGLDVTHNRRWGVNDRSFLGNTWHIKHAAFNGVTEGKPASWVSHAGNMFAVRIGQEAWASANPPPTTASDNMGWLFCGAGGVATWLNRPAWTAGMPVRAGGAYNSTDLNAASAFTGCYSESGQPPAQLGQATIGFGGCQGAGVRGAGVFLSTIYEKLATANGFTTRKADGLTGSNVTPDFVQTSGKVAGDGGYSFGGIGYFGGIGGVRFEGGCIPGQYAYQQAIDRSSGALVPLKVWSATLDWGTAPEGAPSVTLDSNGVLAHAGRSILSKGQMGFAAGAGGSATQEGDKGAAVTLNKACGRVTLHGASLAAGAAVSFALNNSMVGAGDQLLVTIAGGATPGAYHVAADQVSDGTARISLRNMSAASLAEAVVLNVAVIKGAVN